MSLTVEWYTHAWIESDTPVQVAADHWLAQGKDVPPKYRSKVAVLPELDSPEIEQHNLMRTS